MVKLFPSIQLCVQTEISTEPCVSPEYLFPGFGGKNSFLLGNSLDHTPCAELSLGRGLPRLESLRVCTGGVLTLLLHWGAGAVPSVQQGHKSF